MAEEIKSQERKSDGLPTKNKLLRPHSVAEGKPTHVHRCSQRSDPEVNPVRTLCNTRKFKDGQQPQEQHESTKKLESSGAALTQSVELMLDVQERFATVPNGPVADRVTAKLKAVLDKNRGFYVLKQVPNVLSGTDSKIPAEIRASKVPDYKYAPLTSVDVERSFSACKQILTERRHNFKPENLEMVLVCHCFHSLSHSVQSP
ncbi:hypothetical protein HPB50_011775 [Hyalomma asiaticum]|uniref:Uncharacterized protein n=1 Tax=Hyalomma asiaticum TaxID=266040 RepID=A0ACB7S817_HYAAI|nr:hypothetical protein HPB50_011775 [Hyalomma asiaticum]